MIPVDEYVAYSFEYVDLSRIHGEDSIERKPIDGTVVRGVFDAYTTCGYTLPILVDSVDTKSMVFLLFVRRSHPHKNLDVIRVHLEEITRIDNSTELT